MRLSEESDLQDALAAVARYGHLIDDQDWQGLTGVFTTDATVVWLNDQGSTKMAFPELMALWSTYDHPSAHISTNAIVTSANDQEIKIRSKGLAIESDGRAWSVTYQDTLIRTAEGWRISRRTVHERPSLARETRTRH
jgi:hypothetical protein